jgi:hypothetical protein
LEIGRGFGGRLGLRLGDQDGAGGGKRPDQAGSNSNIPQHLEPALPSLPPFSAVHNKSTACAFSQRVYRPPQEDSPWGGDHEKSHSA